MNDKLLLRKDLKSRRSELSQDFIYKGSKLIAENLFRCDEYKSAKVVLCYISTEMEVDTSLIFERACSDKKSFYAPRCEKNSNAMDFYLVRDRDDLERASFNLLEPKESCPKLSGFDGSICIVPALSFDLSGGRIGFGKGFYDRFLASYDGISCGLCFDEFLINILPKEQTDVPVDMIVTQTKILSINDKCF
ncbi:MAG: 5-formyltetrahydrofolate cyclo-ligase [Ruminococcus sp.]|nr:5-formyltetrahydrofolate cyclo-ligase [Ruminococcus sp.]